MVPFRDARSVLYPRPQSLQISRNVPTSCDEGFFRQIQLSRHKSTLIPLQHYDYKNAFENFIATIRNFRSSTSKKSHVSPINSSAMDDEAFWLFVPVLDDGEPIGVQVLCPNTHCLLMIMPKLTSKILLGKRKNGFIFRNRDLTVPPDAK